MTALIDSHSHPWSNAFNADRTEMLARARAAGVATLIIVGCDPASNRASLTLARAGATDWATAGFHPHDAKDITEADWDELEQMVRDPLLVALGEMGLDFFRNISPHDVQRTVFQRQLDLCARYDLPAVIHSRDAAEATWAMLEPWARGRRRDGGSEPFGVMHCYAYDAEMAARYAAAGFMISIPGTVTYPTNARGHEVARAVPSDALVLETDCPYLTPQSRRGKRNEPALMVETLQHVAALRGQSAEQVATQSTANATRLFRLDAATARGRTLAVATDVPPITMGELVQMVAQPSLFGPVQDDMVLVETVLDRVRAVEYPPLARMLDHVLGASGKRMRPAITLLSGSFQDYDLDLLVPLAASIEVLHTATLVHDDVIDQADTRRGRATANALFNNAPSVFLGDFMFAHSAELVARTGNIRVIRLFAQTLMRMATGELQQDVSAYDPNKRISDYLARIAGKTASLFAAASEGGAIVSRAPEEWIATLRDYGFNLGMAFQVMDDILDFTADESILGKPAGNDLKEGTLTLPSLLLLEDDTSPKNPIRRLFGARRNRDRLLEEALAAIRAADVLPRARARAEEYAAAARTTLNVLPATEARHTLAALVDYVLQRDH